MRHWDSACRAATLFATIHLTTYTRRISRNHERQNRRRSYTEPTLLGRHPRHAQSDPVPTIASRPCGHSRFVRYRDRCFLVDHNFGMLIGNKTGGCGQMFEAIIVSPAFEKKTTLARHRLVNNTLKAEIAAIHAWTPKCFTPAEWEKKKGTL